MKVNLSEILADADGIARPGGVPLQVFATRACFEAVNGDEKLSGDEKMKAHALGRKLMAAEDVIDLPVEEVAMLKQRIGNHQAFGPLVVGSAWAILDPQEPEEEETPEEVEEEVEEEDAE